MRKQRGECKQPAALCFWRLLCFHQGDRRCVLRSYLSLRRQARTHLDLSTQPLLLQGCIWCFFFTLLLFSLCARRLPPLFPPSCSSSLCLAHMQGWLNVGVWEMTHLVAHLILACPYLGCPEIHFSYRRCNCGGERGGTMQRHYGELFSTFLFPLCTFYFFIFFLDQGPLISTVLYHQ